MLSTPDPREALRTCLALTGKTIRDLSSATGISKNRLQACFASTQHLTPAEISSCYSQLSSWIIEKYPAHIGGGTDAMSAAPMAGQTANRRNG